MWILNTFHEVWFCVFSICFLIVSGYTLKSTTGKVYKKWQCTYLGIMYFTKSIHHSISWLEVGYLHKKRFESELQELEKLFCKLNIITRFKLRFWWLQSTLILWVTRIYYTRLGCSLIGRYHMRLNNLGKVCSVFFVESSILFYYINTYNKTGVLVFSCNFILPSFFMFCLCTLRESLTPEERWMYNQLFTCT